MILPMFVSELECMGKDCNVLMPEDFVLRIITNPRMRDKYQEYGFRDHVKVCGLPKCMANIFLTVYTYLRDCPAVIAVI